MTLKKVSVNSPRKRHTPLPNFAHEHSLATTPIARMNTIAIPPEDGIVFMRHHQAGF
jgi:hypothetical protein